MSKQIHSAMVFGYIIISNANPNTNFDPNVIDIVCQDDNQTGTLTIGGATGGPNAGWLTNRNLLHYIQNGTPTEWLHGRSIAHEIGHILNLPHAFSCFNNCYDMNNINYCSSNPIGSCDPTWGGSTNVGGNPICTWGIGNNLMGYNGNQTGLTQCQWETMMNHLWTNPPNYIDWCSGIQPDFIINANTTWDGPKIMNRNVIVENGATLTIECCELRMGAGNYIRVERGGRLVVDGATITNHCEDRWVGIEVEGDPSLSQTMANQGSLRILNQSLIQNATTAIFTGTNDWGHQGGAIIEVDNSTFLNNRRSAAFLQYTLADNISYFTDCTFQLDIDYDDLDYIGMITMWDVRGINFTNCTFANENTILTDREYGIYTIDAGFTVTNNCTFEGFEGGIYATNSNTINTFSVDGATFDNNAVGVYAGSVDDIEIINNTYTVGNFNTGTFDHGLFLTTSTGFHIENNTFNRVGTTATPIGIECNNTGDDYNNIYRNIFDGLHFANYAFGDNREKTVFKSTGLEYLCNQNSNNTYDFAVAIDNNYPSNYSGIKYQQGSFANSAGNTFSLNTTPTGSDFDNLSVHVVRYNYDNGTSREPLNTVNVTSVQIANANACNSQINAMVAQLRSNELENEMLRYRNNYLRDKEEFESKIDDGGTQELISSIQSGNTTQILGELHKVSPWVSAEVFMVILASDPITLSLDALVELILRNPDALANSDLLKRLESILDEKDYQSLLQQFQKRNTERTQLEDKIGNSFNKMQLAINQLIRNQLLEYPIQFDKIREWLLYKESINAEYAIVESWLQEKQPENALSHLHSIAERKKLNEKQELELEQYIALTQLKAGAISSDRSIADFDDNEVQELVKIAETGLGRASIQAKGILDFFYDYIISNKPTHHFLGESYKNDGVLNALNNNTNQINEIQQIKVAPNPTNGQIFYLDQLSFTENSHVSILILNQNGKIAEVIALPNKQQSISWNTESLNPGLYFFKIVDATSILGNGRFLLIR